MFEHELAAARQGAPRRWAGICNALTAVALLVMTGCSWGATDTTAALPEAAPTATSCELAIDDAVQYEPPVPTVPVGAAVDVVNRASEAHSVTSDAGAPAAAFDTGLLPEGDDASLHMQTPGLYGYHCSRHPDLMRGTIVVQAPAQPGTAPPAGTDDQDEPR